MNIAIIIPFKTSQQLETEKAVKVMREWEEANGQKAVNEEVKEVSLSQEEIERLNEWVGKEK